MMPVRMSTLDGTSRLNCHTPPPKEPSEVSNRRWENGYQVLPSKVGSAAPPDSLVAINVTLCAPSASKTDQFAAAVHSFEQSVFLLPHDAINRANFGIALAAIGDYDRAEEEA